MRPADSWKDYELIDATNHNRLERWGRTLLIRPDPQIIWKNAEVSPLWAKADAANKPYHKAQESGSGKGGKHRPKPVARHLLNAAAHHIHTGNKQAQSANQGYHSQQHGITSALLHRM